MDEKIRFAGWAAWLDGDSIWWCQDEHCGSAPMQPRTGFEEDMLDEIRRLRAELAYEKDARQAETNRAAELRSELAECKRDAERYRWIKASSTIEPEGSMWALPYVWNWIDMPSPALNVECKSFDEAVDEAMRVDAKAALAAKGER